MLKTLQYKIILEKVLSVDTPVISIADAFKNKRNTIFIDCRERNEYDVSHIENAVYAGFAHFDFIQTCTNKKDEQLIVYCSIGVRSNIITKRLLEAGYINVKNLPMVFLNG